MTEYNPHLCAETIKQAINLQPKFAFILGSGLSGFGEQISDATEIDYQKIPGFPAANISGHAGKIRAGYCHDIPIICCQGRAHRYEGSDAHIIVKNLIRALKLLGVEHLIITNAAGSLDQAMPPGSIMMITDHINFQLDNPLVGENDDEFGPRFPPIDLAYHPPSQEVMRTTAKDVEIDLFEGVYACVMGPSYETKAEINAFKKLGANAVGMSTVPEVIVANHCAMKISALSVITNYATGLASEQHDHNKVVQAAKQAATNLEKLLIKFIKRISDE